MISFAWMTWIFIGFGLFVTFAIVFDPIIDQLKQGIRKWKQHQPVNSDNE